MCTGPIESKKNGATLDAEKGYGKGKEKTTEV
jgi:hypothetical protein